MGESSVTIQDFSAGPLFVLRIISGNLLNLLKGIHQKELYGGNSEKLRLPSLDAIDYGLP